MANYATLKAAIAAAIKQNGNNEITGNLLQQQLLAMVNSLGVGYQYVGIATPETNPGTPDQNVFYLASTAGTYANFDGLVLADGEIAILKYNGTWSKDSTGAASIEMVNQLGQDVAKLNQFNAGDIIELSADNTSLSYLIDSQEPTYPVISASGEKGVITDYIPVGENCYAILLRGGIFKRGGSARFSQEATNVGVAYKYLYPFDSLNVGEQDVVIKIPTNLTFKCNYVRLLINRIDNADTPLYGGSITLLSKVEYENYINSLNLLGVNIFNENTVILNKIVADTGCVIDYSGAAVSDFIKIPKNAKTLVYDGFLASSGIRAVFAKDNLLQAKTDRVVLMLNQTGHGEIDLEDYSNYSFVCLTVFRGSAGDSPSNLDHVDIHFENNITDYIQEKQVFNADDVRVGYSVDSESPYVIFSVQRNQVLTNFIPIPKWAKSLKYSGAFLGGTVRCRFSQYPKDSGDAIMQVVNSSGNGEIDLTKINTETYHYMAFPVFMDVADTVIDLSKVSLTFSQEFVSTPNYFASQRYSWNKMPELYVKKPKIVFIIDHPARGDMDAYRAVFNNYGLKMSVAFEPTYAVLGDIHLSHEVYKSFQQGHELILHSDTSIVWNDTSAATEQQVRNLIVGYLNLFKDKALPFPYGWVTHSGQCKESFKPIIEDYMSYAALNPNVQIATLIGQQYAGDYSEFCNVAEGSSKYNFVRLGIDEGGYQASQIVSCANAAIDKCIELKGLLILYSHGYNDDNGDLTTDILAGIMSHLIPKINDYSCICGRMDEMVNLHFR